jgi:6-pyruvoyltetrahydropterin/6-carboxytetrahydropterin synthase
MHAVTVKHNFETGHRLPMLPGKCQSLHGHSWWCEVTIAGPLNSDGILVDFGALKAGIRSWVDEHLDHGLMLGARDPLLPVLEQAGKVFVFRELDGAWPTVENVAQLIGRAAGGVLSGLDAHPAVHVHACEVRETHVNSATWLAP